MLKRSRMPPTEAAPANHLALIRASESDSDAERRLQRDFAAIFSTA